jgi:hypothetical protein
MSVLKVSLNKPQPGLDSNQAPPEYEHGILPSRQPAPWLHITKSEDNANGRFETRAKLHEQPA